VKVNVTNLNATKPKKKKKNKDKKKKEDKEQQIKEKENEIPFPLLDILFSFIGIQSDANTDDIKQVQTDTLNLFTSQTKTSRATAGTTDHMPGSVNDPTYPLYNPG